MTVPVFITYRDRRSMLDRCVHSLIERGFTDITVIDNDSETPLEPDHDFFKVIRSDNSHRQLAAWMLDLVPDDQYYIAMDCDVELDCPDDVCDVLINILEKFPQVEKVGLGIRTDDLLFPPPEHYSYSYLMEYSVEDRFDTLVPGVILAPTDTHFAMHRPGSGWPGIVGARTTSPYLCRHLPWYNAEYTPEEKLYYARAGKTWTMGHSAGSLLDTTVAVPFTALRSETVISLTGEQVRYAPMLNDESYWELLRDLWADGKSFIIVEHDIVVNETTLDELRVCEHDWCAMPFPYRTNPRAFALACTKFSADLIRRFPNLLEDVALRYDPSHPPKHWCRLDAWVHEYLEVFMHEKRHEHVRAEPLGHVGPQWPTHGCLEK